jgi:hypothetical protein
VRERRYAGPEEAIEPGLLHEPTGATDADGLTADEAVAEVVEDQQGGDAGEAPAAAEAEAQQPAAAEAEAQQPAAEEAEAEQPSADAPQGDAAEASEAEDTSQAAEDAADPSPDAGDGDTGTDTPASAGDPPA